MTSVKHREATPAQPGFEVPAETEAAVALGARLDREDSARVAQCLCDEVVDEALEESFPASDAPAWTHCSFT